jgi:pimeloyl-ACP methyl ester carboxylesterase
MIIVTVSRRIKSTIVRSFQRQMLRTIRLAFAVLEAVAPGLAGRWAANLWFRPLGSARSTVTPSTEGRRLSVPVHGRAMSGEVWGSGPTVYLLHGWGGRRGQLGAFVDPLVAAGYRVVSVDAPSHGESPSGTTGRNRATIMEFADVLNAAIARVGPPHAVIAHSIGCMATAHALRNGLRVDRLVFLAPMGAIAPYTHEFARRVGLGERVRARMVERIEHRIDRSLSYFDIAPLAKELDTPRLLLVHDREDAETNWSDSAAIAASWPRAELFSTTGLGHQRILREPGVRAEILAFVGPPPGPAELADATVAQQSIAAD